MLWLALNFYQLPLDVFLLKEQSIKDIGEFAVVENNRLVYCNDKAINKGMQASMKLSTAYALSEQLKTKQRSKTLEKNTLTQLATIAYEFSSQVCLYNEKTILLEVAASCKLFTNLAFLLEQLALKIEHYSILNFAALSDTIKSAYLLSVEQRYCLNDIVQLSQRETVDNILKANRFFISKLSIESLVNILPEPLSDQPRKIRKMGIRSIGELNQLPSNSIGRRFGRLFVKQLHYLKGGMNEFVSLFKLAESFSIQRFFINGLDTLEQILFPAKAMLEHLVLFLKLRRIVAVNITWRFTCFNGDELFFRIDLSSEVQSVKQLMMLTRLKFKGFVLQEKIEALFLDVKEFAGVEENQSEINLTDVEFSHHDVVQTYSMDIANLMDKLHVRLGMDKCLMVSANDQYLPENISLKTQWSKSKPVKRNIPNYPEKQPLWLRDEPKKINCYRSSCSYQLNYQGFLFIVSKKESVDANWWSQHAKRDYYVAQHISGIFYWVFYDLYQKSWYVHGVF